MFIAHHVVIIDNAFRQKLLTEDGLSSAGEEEEREPKLAELVPKMRRLGNDSFSSYIDNKKTQLGKLITEASGIYCIAFILLLLLLFVFNVFAHSSRRRLTDDSWWLFFNFLPGINVLHASGGFREKMNSVL